MSDAGGQVGLLEGHLVRTLASRLLPQDLASMTMRGARPAGPEPATAALPRAIGRTILAAGEPVEVERKVHSRDGHVKLAGQKIVIGPGYLGRPWCSAWTATSCTPSPTTL
ncbi:hypothetical protein [Nonomuraea sp. NPDC050202]|uniref:hypothetical protein n=1 Tax=Nonomuraea sp. NPDC050202 TaxID=3155035 RepID=UPI0034041496